jgi:diaminopimelate epimerase
MPLLHRIDLKNETLEATILSMGNPHAVQVVADVERAPVRTQGPLLERHARFPNRVNAGYLQPRDRHRVALRVWERGAGETLACGTGACAAAVAGILRGLLDSPVAVEARGGTLTVSWAGGDNAVWMKGPARSVFEGEIEL